MPAGGQGNLLCLSCGAQTHGMPVEGLGLGPRSAKYVRDSRVLVCVGCWEAFIELVQSEDEAGTVTQLDPDEEPESPRPSGQERDMDNDLKHNLLSFASAATGRTLHSIWRDGGSIYGVARNIVVRAAYGATYSAGGAVLGAITGFVTGPPSPRGPESERDRLLRQVKMAEIGRTALPTLTQMLTSIEYDARKSLEEMGYYPCEHCGEPHVKEERHNMPEGTYWSEGANRYLKPDDADWTKEGYEQAAGERWEYADADAEDEDDSGEQIH